MKELLSNFVLVYIIINLIRYSKKASGAELCSLCRNDIAYKNEL